jgi:hypothetical protein
VDLAGRPKDPASAPRRDDRHERRASLIELTAVRVGERSDLMKVEDGTALEE